MNDLILSPPKNLQPYWSIAKHLSFKYLYQFDIKKKGKYYWIHEAFPQDAKSHSYAAFVAMNEQAVYSLHTWNKEGSR